MVHPVTLELQYQMDQGSVNDSVMTYRILKCGKDNNFCHIGKKKESSDINETYFLLCSISFMAAKFQ